MSKPDDTRRAPEESVDDFPAPWSGSPILRGAMLEFLVGTIPAAILVGRAVSDSHWFDSAPAILVALAAIALAAVAIPAAIGRLLQRWWWVPTCALAAEASVLVGTAIGYGAARWVVRDLDGGSNFNEGISGAVLFVGFVGLFIALTPALLSAALGVALWPDESSDYATLPNRLQVADASSRIALGLRRLVGPKRILSHGDRALTAAAAALVVLAVVAIVASRVAPEEEPEHRLARPGPCTSGTASTPVAPAVTPSGPIADVPMIGVDAGGSGAMPGPAPAGEPALRWCFPLGGRMRGGPVVGNGMLFVTAVAEAGGPQEGILYALDAATGKERWRFVSPGRRLTAPAVSGETVFVGANLGTADTFRTYERGQEPPPLKFFALDARTGRQRWVFTVTPHLIGGVIYVSGFGDPVVADGLVYAQTNELFALEADTGAVRWIGAGTIGAGRPAIANASIFGVTINGSLVTWDATTGAPRRQSGGQGTPPGGEVVASTDGLVLFNSTGLEEFVPGQLSAYDATTGALL